MKQQQDSNEYVKKLTEEKYKYGFTTDVHTDIIDRGLTEDTVRLISEKKGEPAWLLDFRLKAYRHWLTMDMPTWAHLRIPEIDYQGISYYADPTAQKKDGPRSLDDVDPELIKTFNKLGIPLEEQMALSGMAVDAVMDSVSVKKASSSAPSARPCASIRTWCNATWAAWCPIATTSSPRSTPPSSPTGRSCTSPVACAARWS